MVRYAGTTCLVLVFLFALSAVPVPSIPAADGTMAVSVIGAPSVPPDQVQEQGGLFTENLGQWGDGVAFVAQCPFGHAVFGPRGVTYDVAREGGGHRLSVAFSGVGDVRPSGVGDAGFPTSFLLGRDPSGWVTGVRSYRELLYEEVWPGIDVRYRFAGGDLKYDVLVGPEADPASVGFDLEGHGSLAVAGDRLDILMPGGGAVHDSDLVAWYEDGMAAEVRFRTAGDGDGFGFEVDKEPGRALVIDPVVLHSSTFLGGTYDDQAYDVALDSEGCIYVAGQTGSGDFPVTSGAYSETSQALDASVTKLNHNCSEVLWATFLGGSSTDFLCDIEVDEEDGIYLYGGTWSEDFPVTAGAFSTKMNLGEPQGHGRPDLWVTKLAPGGDRLEYSTYVGGSGPETAGDLKVWKGNATVVGWTDSKDFPTDTGSFGALHGDGFLLMLDPKGRSAVAFNYWGGFSSEMATSLEFASNGDAVVGGRTSSIDFFTTHGVFQESQPSLNSGFVSRYSFRDGEVKFATYLGGAHDSVTALTLDEDSNILATGYTFYCGPGTTFPVTDGAIDTEYNGDTEAFVCKMDPDGTRLIYSTLVGGDGRDYVYDIEADADGNAVVAGILEEGGNYTVTDGCHDPSWEGEGEGFVLVLDGDGMTQVYSSYHGGSHDDGVMGLEIDELDNLVVAGYSGSRDLPVTDDAFQTRPGGYVDSFVSIIGELTPPSAPRELTATGQERVVVLDWQQPADDGGYPVLEYLVHRGTSADALAFHDVTGGSRHFLDVNVEVGVEYHYAVLATNGKGESPRSNVATATAYVRPDPPLNLTAAVDLDGVTLEWEAPAFTGGLDLAGFSLLRSDDGGPMSHLRDVGSELRLYRDMEVVDGTGYTYELVARHAFMGSVGNPTVTVRTHAVPSPPRDLAETHGDTYVELTWEAPLEQFDLPLTKYRIYRSTGEGAGELVAETGPAILSLVDEGVEIGTSYVYRVTAVNAKGESEPSPGLEVTPVVPPGPPTDVAARAEERFVRVTWSPPAFDGASPVLRYRVYLGEDLPGGVCLGIVNVEGMPTPTLAFLHDVPYDGVPRSYLVTAENAEGEGVPSDVAVTVAYEPPSPPRDVAVARGDCTLSISWEAPASDGGTPVLLYTLYRRDGATGGFSRVATLTVGALRYLDDTTLNGVEYAYRLTATNLVGEGAPSAEASMVPAGVPDPPADVSAESLDSSARVTWEAPAWTGGLPVTGYRVYGVLGGMELHLVAEVDGDARDHLVPGLVNGQVYLYAVLTLTDVGESDLSTVVEARPVGPPGAPESPVAQWTGDRVVVTWSAPSFDGGTDVTGYMLRRDDWEPDRWSELPALQLAFVDLDVERGRTYNYTVHALNGVGRGSDSSAGVDVPPEERAPPETSSSSVWPALLAVALLVAAASALYVWRAGSQERELPEEEEGVV